MDAIFEQQLGRFGTCKGWTDDKRTPSKTLRAVLSHLNDGRSVIDVTTAAKRWAEVMGSPKYKKIIADRLYEIFGNTRDYQWYMPYNTKKWGRFKVCHGLSSFIVNPFVMCVLSRARLFHNMRGLFVVEDYPDWEKCNFNDPDQKAEYENLHYRAKRKNAKYFMDRLGRYLHRWLKRSAESGRQLTFAELGKVEREIKEILRVVETRNDAE